MEVKTKYKTLERLTDYEELKKVSKAYRVFSNASVPLVGSPHSFRKLYYHHKTCSAMRYLFYAMVDYHLENTGHPHKLLLVQLMRKNDSEYKSRILARMYADKEYMSHPNIKKRIKDVLCLWVREKDICNGIPCGEGSLFYIKQHKTQQGHLCKVFHFTKLGEEVAEMVRNGYVF